jgi:hypothetical protein
MTTIILPPLMIRRVRMDDHIGTNRECTGVVANLVEHEKARNLESDAQSRDAQIVVAVVVKNKKYQTPIFV